MINWLWFWWRCRRWCWFRNRMTCRFMTCHRCRRCLVIDFVVDATSLSSMKLISQSYGIPCHLMTCHGCRRRLSSLISVVILSLMIRRYHCRRWLWLWCRCRRWWCRCRRWCWFRNRMTVVLWRVIVVMVVSRRCFLVSIVDGPLTSMYLFVSQIVSIQGLDRSCVSRRRRSFYSCVDHGPITSMYSFVSQFVQDLDRSCVPASSSIMLHLTVVNRHCWPSDCVIVEYRYRWTNHVDVFVRIASRTRFRQIVCYCVVVDRVIITRITNLIARSWIGIRDCDCMIVWFISYEV